MFLIPEGWWNASDPPGAETLPVIVVAAVLLLLQPDTEIAMDNAQAETNVLVDKAWLTVE